MSNRKPREMRQCPVCGRYHARAASSKVRHCGHGCGAVATRGARVDRGERVREAAKELGTYIKVQGTVPPARTFAQQFTGRKDGSAIAALCQYVDPRQIVFGSYRATVDAIYAEAGVERPDGRSRGTSP